MKKLFFLTVSLLNAWISCSYSEERSLKRVYITPGYWGELFSIGNPIYNRDNCLEVLYRLRDAARSEGYELRQAHDLYHLEDFEYLVVFDIIGEEKEALSLYPKEKKILFLWEPPSVIPANYNLENHRDYAKVITWHDGLIDNEKYFKFYYPVLRPLIPHVIDFDYKSLCTLIACNKGSDYPTELYSARRNLIDFYENHPYADFTLFGKWWPYSLKNYAGPIETKVDTLKYFRFCYAYENVEGIPGYITEKIFDCFQAGTVPIYWGAPNLSDYIPKDCYISRTDFADDDSLYAFLSGMKKYEYEDYLKNIRTFLQSQEAQLYSQDHFISLFLKLIATPPSER